MMTLHYSPASPYARKVLVLLHETQQTESVELAFATGTPIDPQTMPIAANPLGKLPALERTDGCALYDSRVITRYLAAQVPGCTLYPEGNRLWEVLTLEATADGILDAALLIRYEGLVRAEDKRSAEWIAGQWSKIARSLDVLEARWMAHLEGPLCMGQIAVGCALGYLDFRLGDRNWRDGHPSLANWEGRFRQRPSMQATIPG